MREIGRIAFDWHDFLGQGAFSTVFSGTFCDIGIGERSPVAVKRIQNVDLNTGKREVEALKKLKGHPNIVFLFWTEKDAYFHYFALERCAASMDQIFLPDDDPKKYKGPLPSDLDVLLQLTEGLQHIHENGFLHRNIKPDNVLISYPKDDGTVEMKWADFGLSKPVSYRARGMTIWIAPEILAILEEAPSEKTHKWTVESDTWSFGCVVFAYLTKGKHPFGNWNILPSKLNDSPYNLLKALPRDHFAFNIVKGMIQKDPVDRMKVTDVVDILKKVKETGIIDLQRQELGVNARRELEAGQLYSWKQWNLVLKNVQLFVWSDDVAIEGIPPQIQESDDHMKIDKEPGRKDRDRKMLNLVGIPQGTPSKSIRNAQFASHEREWTVGSSELGDQLIIKEDVHDGDRQKWEMVLFDGDSFHSTFHVTEDGDQTTVWMTDKAKDEMVDELLKLCSSSSPTQKDPDRIAALLRVGINPNCTNSDGETPLILCLAKQTGHSRLKTLEILLDGNQSRTNQTIPKQVKMNVQDRKDRNAFQLLLEGKGGIEDCTTYQALELLVRGGIDVNLKSKKDGRTALHLLCLNYKREDIVDVMKLLIENGVMDIGWKDKNGKAAMEYLEEDPKMAGYKEKFLEMMKTSGFASTTTAQHL